jgi:hypothetical protein
MKLERVHCPSNTTYMIDVYDLQGPDLDVDTGLFAKKPYRVIAVIDAPDENFDVHELQTVADTLSMNLDSGNDGGLWWIPASAAPHFPDFAKRFLFEAFQNDELNLDNGGVSEAFVLYDAGDGLVVAMIDPESGTSVFDTAISLFLEEQNIIAVSHMHWFDPSKSFNFEDCHLSSNLKIGRNDQCVDIFLRALQERGLINELETEHQ